MNATPLRPSTAVLLVLLLQACASSPLPAQVPPESAASIDAESAPHADVTIALGEDPPLPGERSERWPGLAASPDSAEEHRHVHGHAHGHGQQAQPHHGTQPSRGQPGEPAPQEGSP